MIFAETFPGAQTEGMIEGMGGGMDDMVGGMIEQQPVAVSPGEYIVPADVVSGLGDGSSDAGAAELDAMMGRVRMARGAPLSRHLPLTHRNPACMNISLVPVDHVLFPFGTMSEVT